MTDNELVNTLDFDDMLCSLSKGEKLTKDEKLKLASFIQTQISSPKEKRSLEDLYGAFTVVTKSNDRSLSYLLELAFEIPDPLLVCLALETLIIKWGIYENYVERLIQYALGTSYDHDGDIRESAFECIECILLTSPLKNNISQKLAHLLIHIIDDKLESENIKTAALKILELRKEGKRSA